MSFVVGGMALFMALCALIGFGFELAGFVRPLDEGASAVLLGSSAITALVAFGGWRFGRGVPGDRHMNRRDATLAVALIWFGAGIFGGLPFVMGAGLSPADAFFEAVSGFTTTGATIFGDIEGVLSRPLLLWRSIIQWLGGMGIVVLFVAVFPNVGVGGKHMFRSEVPGPTAEGLVPRITETSLALWAIYTAITVLQIAVLWVVGLLEPVRDGVPRMDLFQSVCHALTTMSTGGFSPQNASIGAFDSTAIDIVISVFMLVAGVNFGLYYGALAGRSFRVLLRATEFKVYLLIIGVSVLLVMLGILDKHPEPVQAFRYALFNVATFITSTGYGNDDYMGYSPPALTIILLLMFIGAMSGSTAGGVKVSRVVLLAKSSWAQIRRTVRPSVVQVVRMDRKSVPAALLGEVAIFFFVFMLFMGVGTLLVTYTDGVSPQTGFGAMLTSLSNMGPAPFYDGADNFAAYSDVAKIWFSFAMILGRLEFFTLLALLLPDFWRR
ncbi:MAG: TrkH family potassium uptake protein [Alphaproteobacteria bacterium]|nr:TrkH family potassium uptake protein [Alphaproteobacteria bacterium]